MKRADEQLARFIRTLEGYDNPAVQAIVNSTPLAIEVSDLTTAEWLQVLEMTAGELYLTASDRSRDDYIGEWIVRWYPRHDGDAYIYETEDTGELYHDTEGENAYRQVKSVIDNHDVMPYPMANYPIEHRDPDEFQTVPTDR